ncbi:MAG TPA: hypothetical protein VHZ03_25225 [Trebonia sp.]|jgi:hypothetical protein|nr:hypothetical protein [Trebonia sp.]
MFKCTLIAVSAAAALSAAGAVPALASGSPSSSGANVNISATVNGTETLSLTGLSSTITFPAATAGNTVTATSAENYTVSLADGSGYTLTIAPAANLSDSSGDTIPNSDLSIDETTLATGGWNSPGPVNLGNGNTIAGTEPVILDQESTGSASGSYLALANS